MPLAVSLSRGSPSSTTLMVLFAMEEGPRGRPAQAGLDGLSLRAGDPRLPNAAPLLLVRRRRLLEVRHDLPRTSSARSISFFPHPLCGRAGVRPRDPARPPSPQASRATTTSFHPHQHGDRLPVDRVLPLPDRHPGRPLDPAAPGAEPGAAAEHLLLMLLAMIPTAAIGQAPAAGGGRAAPRSRRLPRRRPTLLLDQARGRGGASRRLSRRSLQPDLHPRPGRTLPDGQDPGHLGGTLRPPRARRSGRRWRPGQPVADAKVDLLCDPVTLRYASESDEPVGARRTERVFSPIIFVTGVSCCGSAAWATSIRRCSGSSPGPRRARWR